MPRWNRVRTRNGPSKNLIDTCKYETKKMTPNDDEKALIDLKEKTASLRIDLAKLYDEAGSCGSGCVSRSITYLSGIEKEMSRWLEHRKTYHRARYPADQKEELLGKQS